MMKFCLLWLNLFADLLSFLVLSLRSNSSLAAENLFLRKQLAVLPGTQIKPRRTSHPARLTLLWLSRWFNWRSALIVVTPKTFIAWHRKGFQFFWRRKCQSGRPRIPPELQQLIRQMALENPSWGEERIANELLLKLGLRVSPRTIRKYLPKLPPIKSAGRAPERAPENIRALPYSKFFARGSALRLRSRCYRQALPRGAAPVWVMVV
jgi:hypothetical protein